MNKMKKAEFLSRAIAKNIKKSRGHDGPSFEWDIYFDGKKICNCWDDSYGGELKVTDYPNQSIESIYDSIDKDSLWDKEYEWTTSQEILLHTLLNIGLMKKDEKKGVLIGSVDRYRIEGYKTSIPKTFEKWPKDSLEIKKDLQDIINKAIKKGESILNLEYLKTYDLKA